MGEIETYPPLFRRSPLSLNPPQLPLTSTPEEDSSSDALLPIPVIDLERLDSSTLLDQACREWGIFHLVNHGIPSSTLAHLTDLTATIFGLPFHTKQETFNTPISYFWGTPVLTPAGSAVSPSRGINLVEGMNFPLTQLPMLDSQLPLVASFRELLEEYGKNMGRIATTLFKAMAKTLQLDPAHCDGYLSETTGFIRAYRYPRSTISGSEEDVPGMVAHTDSSVMAILMQNEVNGLEVERDGRWIPVKPVPGGLVVNLGDMMKAMSDDGYKSVRHRVRAPREDSDRISICYFVFPEKGSLIRSSSYRDFTYQEFQQQVQLDVKTMGAKVGLNRFKRHAVG